MRFLYVMDPMDRVAWDKDTTFAFQRAAQRRGHRALHCLPTDLYTVDGDVHARARALTVSSDAGGVTFGEVERVRIADIDAVLIRKDPPFDDTYLYATLLLERARGRTLIVNDPRGLRDANEKLYTLHFSHHMPHTLVSASEAQLLEFVEETKAAVIKPLDGAGGSGVMLIREGDKNARAIIALLTGEGRRLAMIQTYLPAVEAGDKRVLLLEGKSLGAILRVPRGDDLRSNIHVGGSVVPCQLTAKEQAIVDDIGPRLVADGLIFVGLDMIGERLTEVNVTSPTGIQELSTHLGRDVAEDVIEWIERRTSDFRPQLRSIPAI
ncbi:MAG: glutathione synthase [Myxococcales bacterium]|nr:glutathione synthase [Myxococcales bacterium]